MATDVIMPQMGESITEGTITRWRAQAGDAVERDDPLFDLATDKVDTEVPSPVTGRLAEILVPEGETVEVNTVVARIAAEGESWEPTESGNGAAPEESGAETEAAEARPADEPPQPQPRRRRPRSSPLVRRMARENDVDLADVPGSGEGGRITKQDMLDWIANRAASAAPPAEPPTPAPPVPVELPPKPGPTPVVEPEPIPVPALAGDRTEPMSRMRRTIAEHMGRSRRTSAHVTTVFEVDMSRVMAVRAAAAGRFEERTGLRLTLTPFFARAAVEALDDFPILNASIAGDDIVFHRTVGLGIAVALPDGLIVPVVRGADERNFVGLARGIHDVANRARSGELQPDEVTGGTFTITNPGPYGALFGTPIIAQPQVAVVGVGGVHKRPVVIEGDAIAVRSMVFLALSFDHRLIDGAVADQFMAAVKRRLENWPDGEP